MFRKILLTYYYVWFQGHKRSKYAHHFSKHYFDAFLQVSLTLFLLIINLSMILEKVYSVKLLFFLSNKWVAMLVYLGIPSIILYYILFGYLKADKENDDPSQFGITITKKARIISWIVFVSCPLICFLLLGLGIRK